MHPVIRVISFLILSAFVVFGGVYELAFGLLIVLSVVLVKRLQSLEISLRIVKRMKWFFLSILVLYLWFTPGAPLFGISVAGMPTVEGISTGALRVMSLILVIFAVNYFVTSIARNKLVEAIVWLLYPIKLLGIDNTTLALRIALVLEIIPKVQNIVLEVRQGYQDQLRSSAESASNKAKLTTKLTAASQLVEQLFVRIVDEADKMPNEKLEIASSSYPPVLQWAVPLLLIVSFVWIKTL